MPPEPVLLDPEPPVPMPPLEERLRCDLPRCDDVDVPLIVPEPVVPFMPPPGGYVESGCAPGLPPGPDASPPGIVPVCPVAPPVVVPVEPPLIAPAEPAPPVDCAEAVAARPTTAAAVKRTLEIFMSYSSFDCPN